MLEQVLEGLGNALPPGWLDRGLKKVNRLLFRPTRISMATLSRIKSRE